MKIGCAMAALTLCTLSASTSLGQVLPYVTSWGGFGPANEQFQNPVGVVVDPAGIVYVIDNHGQYLKRFTRSGTYLSQWPVDDPLGIALGPDGNLYLTRGLSSGTAVVSKYTKAGALLAQWNAGGAAKGIAVDTDGSVYVAVNEGPLRKYSPFGLQLAQWGTEGTGNGQFRILDGVAVDGLGHVYTAEAGGHRIQKFTTAGTYITQWGMEGSADGQFESPVRLVTSHDGSLLYVVDNQNSRIQVFTSAGAYVGQWGTAGGNPGEFRNPIGIAIDSVGNVFVADTNNGRIQVFGDAATPTRQVSWSNLKERYQR
jgi:sugar lactone lactonase YvrE